MKTGLLLSTGRFFYVLLLLFGFAGFDDGLAAFIQHILFCLLTFHLLFHALYAYRGAGDFPSGSRYIQFMQLAAIACLVKHQKVI